MDGHFPFVVGVFLRNRAVSRWRLAAVQSLRNYHRLVSDDMEISVVRLSPRSRVVHGRDPETGWIANFYSLDSDRLWASSEYRATATSCNYSLLQVEMEIRSFVHFVHAFVRSLSYLSLSFFWVRAYFVGFFSLCTQVYVSLWLFECIRSFSPWLIENISKIRPKGINAPFSPPHLYASTNPFSHPSICHFYLPSVHPFIYPCIHSLSLIP